MALVKESSYTSCSREGNVGWCYWSELEPSCDGSISERWRCCSPCSQAAYETHSGLSEGGGSTHGELHMLVTGKGFPCRREGFMLAKYILVLVLKRGERNRMIQWQNTYDARRRAGTLFQVTVLLDMSFMIFDPSVPQLSV